MGNKNEISHTGKILEITPEFVTVEIISSSACSECHAKGMCGMSEEKVKVIMAPADPYASYGPGDEVDVVLKKSMGMKAVWISYVIPLIILMIIILSLSVLSAGEMTAGLCAIAGVALYYLAIYLFRDRLAKDFVFVVKERKQY